MLRRVLPAHGRVLEIASGTGQHAAAFAGAFPHLDFQPSDLDPAARNSIAAWTAAAGAGNVSPPQEIDVTVAHWGEDLPAPFAAIMAINLTHISPWAASLGLIEGAGRLLADDGILYLYGPYSRGGRHTADSNAAFDLSLRQQDPHWGVRDLDDIAAELERVGLAINEMIEMPANNYSLIIRRTRH